MLHTNQFVLCEDECACLVWKNTSIDFSDWPLYTHRSHLFEPVQSGRVFLFLNCCHFSIDCSCLIMRKKQRLHFSRGMCVLSSHTLRHGQSGPRQVYDSCVSARCCCPLTVFLTAERCCRKVITSSEMDDGHTILNTQSMKNLAISWLLASRFVGQKRLKIGSLCVFISNFRWVTDKSTQT